MLLLTWYIWGLSLHAFDVNDMALAGTLGAAFAITGDLDAKQL